MCLTLSFQIFNPLPRRLETPEQFIILLLEFVAFFCGLLQLGVQLGLLDH
jgi:hypothetical protein